MKEADAPMGSKLEEIEAEAMGLDSESRAELVRRLTESLEQSPQAATTSSENERERLWIQEAMRRNRELRTRAADSPAYGSANAPSAAPARHPQRRRARKPRPAPRKKKRAPAARSKPRRPVRKPARTKPRSRR